MERSKAQLITLMVFDGLLILAYFVMPWISVSAYIIETQSVTGFTALTSIIKGASTLNDFGGMSYMMQSDAGGYVVLLIIFLIIWFLIPLYSAVALIKYATGRNETALCKFSKIAYVIAVSLTVVLFIMRLALISNSGYGSGLVSDVLQFRMGYYLTFVIALLGLFLPMLFGKIEQNSEAILGNEAISNLRKNFNPARKQSEETGNLLPTVILESPQSTVKVFNLPCVIGRNKEEVDYYVYHETISRRHCELNLSEGRLVVRDLGAVHGVYINGERIKPEQYYLLYDNDTLALGKQLFRVKIDESLMNVQCKNTTEGENNRANSMNRQNVESFEIKPKAVYNDELTEMVTILEEEDGTMMLSEEFEDDATVVLSESEEKTVKKWQIICEKSPDGQESETCIITKTPFVIGKSVGVVDYCVVNKAASKQHCKIDKTGDMFFITDLESTNGTKINDLKIEGATRLYEGDHITIGECVYRFEKQ